MCLIVCRRASAYVDVLHFNSLQGCRGLFNWKDTKSHCISIRHHPSGTDFLTQRKNESSFSTSLLSKVCNNQLLPTPTLLAIVLSLFTLFSLSMTSIVQHFPIHRIEQSIRSYTPEIPPPLFIFIFVFFYFNTAARDNLDLIDICDSTCTDKNWPLWFISSCLLLAIICQRICLVCRLLLQSVSLTNSAFHNQLHCWLLITNQTGYENCKLELEDMCSQ